MSCGHCEDRIEAQTRLKAGAARAAPYDMQTQVGQAAALPAPLATPDHLLAGLAVGADADARREALGLDRGLHRDPTGDQQPLDQAALAIGGVALLEEGGDALHNMGNATHHPIPMPSAARRSLLHAIPARKGASARALAAAGRRLYRPQNGRPPASLDEVVSAVWLGCAQRDGGLAAAYFAGVARGLPFSTT